MRWKRVAPWIAVGVLGGGTALLVPALADGAEQPPPPGAAVSMGTAQQAAVPLAGVVARDLQLDQGEAAARLAKESWAAGTEAQLRRELGDGFGGAWLTADAQSLVVGVTTDAAAARVSATGATPQRVARTETTLDAVKRQLDTAGDRASKAVSGWFVDPATNTVVITATASGQADARRLATASGAPSDAVRVVTAEDQPRPLFDVRGGDAYFINQRSRCSVGFAVQGGFVTAGHCGTPGATTTGSNNVAQGTFRASTFPGNGDFAFVATNGNWVPTGFVNTFDGRTVPVAGSAEAPVGASICRSGSTTGTHCGVIQARNQTVNYPEGAVTGLTRTNVCAEAGDSGGSWLSGDQAQGVTSGGSGDCTRGGTTFFQPVTEILAANNLTLVTAGTAPPTTVPPTTAPPATAPPTTAPPTSAAPGTGSPSAPGCADQRSQLSGSLTGPGAQQIQPSGGFYRARAGTQTICLSGPAAANYDLALQRWDGRQFRTVASSTRAGAAELITFRGSATAFYRIRVTSVSGSGLYALGVTLP